MKIDKALNLIRNWACKTQGRYHVSVPQAGTGDRSPFEVHLIDTDIGGRSPCFWIKAVGGVAHGWGDCPDDALEARIYAALREGGFDVVSPTGRRQCAIRKVKPVRKIAPEPKGGERWKVRVKLLERRQRFAQEVLDGKHDTLVRAQRVPTFEEYLDTFGDPDLVPY